MSCAVGEGLGNRHSGEGLDEEQPVSITSGSRLL